ncbi:hypothetical protein NDU88_005818 [Pleurodeles waltl]|uniref:Uncharacterized protein n=1 Tax=Pleurodeles waltl TaxID=8319 RepID=A0AAV7NNI0_PLEWA|nr:hypothetical protein NDU88_005818 [Pleurodeles waltl]
MLRRFNSAPSHGSQPRHGTQTCLGRHATVTSVHVLAFTRRPSHQPRRPQDNCVLRSKRRAGQTASSHGPVRGGGRKQAQAVSGGGLFSLASWAPLLLTSTPPHRSSKRAGHAPPQPCRSGPPAAHEFREGSCHSPPSNPPAPPAILPSDGCQSAEPRRRPEIWADTAGSAARTWGSSRPPR